MASSEIAKKIVSEDPWHSLRSFTQARIALGRTGVSVPLKEVLSFRLAHAFARDAVFSELNTKELVSAIQSFDFPVLSLRSLAYNRTEYLQRPDLGRKLHKDSMDKLRSVEKAPYDIAIIIADGLSSSAANLHAIPLLKKIIGLTGRDKYSFAPVTLVEQGRVAIADEIGFLLKAKLSMILLGERPGLTTAESLGAYITYEPKPGLTDDMRNCVSNIHKGGLSYDAAAQKIFYFTRMALKLKLSGINIKEDNKLLR